MFKEETLNDVAVQDLMRQAMSASSTYVTKRLYSTWAVFIEKFSPFGPALYLERRRHWSLFIFKL